MDGKKGSTGEILPEEIATTETFRRSGETCVGGCGGHGMPIKQREGNLVEKGSGSYTYYKIMAKSLNWKVGMKKEPFDQKGGEEEKEVYRPWKNGSRTCCGAIEKRCRGRKTQADGSGRKKEAWRDWSLKSSGKGGGTQIALMSWRELGKGYVQSSRRCKEGELTNDQECYDWGSQTPEKKKA